MNFKVWWYTSMEFEGFEIRTCFIEWLLRSITFFKYVHAIFDVHMSVHLNIITNYSQQDAVSLEFIYFYRCCTCFRRFLRPSSGAHNCTCSFRYCQSILLLAVIVEEMELLSISPTIATSSSIDWQYLKIYVQLCAPDDVRRNRRLKHVEHL
jgi:hypothetical protein